MKKFVMIGAPVTYVRTPDLLEDHFKNRGIEVKINAKHLEPSDLENFMSFMKDNLAIDGLLVTMPHKKTVLKYLTKLSKTSLLLGSVNTIKRINSGGLAGTQFDGIALVNALSKFGVSLKEISILLAGAGGAGTAIALALSEHCKMLTITEKDSEHALSCISMLAKHSNGNFKYLVGADIKKTHYDLLINATPVGMREEDPSPFDDDLISRADWVADIVYDPPVTKLGLTAKNLGKSLISGRDMVRGQIEPIADWLLDCETI